MERESPGSPSHYEGLLDAIAEEQRLNPQGTPISTIDSLMPRSRQAPFTEGEDFSGNVYSGQAEVSLTLAASSHFRPTIPLKEFLSEASQAFGQEAKLPNELPPDQKVAPHMIVWWQANNGAQKSQADLFNLSAIPQKERADFTSGIKAQVIKAFSALDSFEGQPIIYGSWGYSEPESRARFGFSRGAPTLPDGHLHLAKVNIGEQDISLSPLPVAPTLKHYQPWNRLINKQLGPDIVQMLDGVCRRNGWETVENVYFYDHEVKHGESHFSHQQGYEVTYRSPQLLESALDHIVHVAGEFEELYQGISALYADYHLNSGNQESQRRILARMQEVGESFGFSNQAVEKLASFVARIVPTSSQLNEWAARLEQDTTEESSASLEIIKRELERRALLMARSSERDDSIAAALVKDTYRDPRDHDIVHTWPAHSSAIYLLDDVEVRNGDVLVHKFSIHPAIVSAAGAPEKLLGAAIVRDMGSIA